MGSCSIKTNNGQRGNKSSYALVVLLAFVATILGVMVVHKVREKRIFNLLVKDKHQQIVTLNLLFQREKELNQEARKKIEEMKTKVYSLRTQKLELDKKVTQMESTISSLMDERKVIRLALKEKKNEFKMLATRENPEIVDMFQITALKNIIKMKDEEIRALNSKPEISCTVAKKHTENAIGLQGSSNSSGKGTLDSAKTSGIRLNEEQKSGENQSVEWSNDSETREEFNLEDHPRNLNQTVDIGQSREEETKNEQQGSLTSTKEGSYEHVKNQMRSEGANERKQISDENSKQLQDRKVNAEHNMETRYENDKEQENEEGEAEEDTHQLEIDRDDITTFLETNVEEADSDESEF